MDRFVLFALISLLFNLGQGAPPATKLEASTASDPLENHFKDIMALIPKGDLMNITNEHLENDDEFRAAVAYMQSKEWTDLIQAIRVKPEWIELKKFLADAGLDLDVGIKCIEGLIGNATVTLEPQRLPIKKSLKSFLADVEMALPTIKILNLIQAKVVKGVNFKDLFDKLSSEDTHNLVEKVFALPEIKRVLIELAGMDVDLSTAFSLMYSIFGWGEFKALN